MAGFTVTWCVSSFFLVVASGSPFFFTHTFLPRVGPSELIPWVGRAAVLVLTFSIQNTMEQIPYEFLQLNTA